MFASNSSGSTMQLMSLPLSSLAFPFMEVSWSFPCMRVSRIESISSGDLSISLGGLNFASTSTGSTAQFVSLPLSSLVFHFVKVSLSFPCTRMFLLRSLQRLSPNAHVYGLLHHLPKSIALSLFTRLLGGFFAILLLHCALRIKGNAHLLDILIWSSILFFEFKFQQRTRHLLIVRVNALPSTHFEPGSKHTILLLCLGHQLLQLGKE